MNHYETNLDKNKANHVPLTPLTFLNRAKDIYPNYEAIIYEDRKYTWMQVYKRCLKFASALEKIGIKKGDTIGVMAWDTIRYLEFFFTIPMMGAILHTINIRLSEQQILYTINHADDDILIVHHDFIQVIDKIRKNQNQFSDKNVYNNIDRVLKEIINGKN